MPANSENLIAPLLKLASYVHSDSSGIVIAPTPANEQTIDVPTPATTDNVTNRDPLLDKLKEHIVQIEALLVFVILFNGVQWLVANAVEGHTGKLIAWFVPLVFLGSVRLVIRVTNPTSSVRNRLTWGCVFGSAVGFVAGAVCDVLTGGFSLGQGSLIGFAAGASVGTIVGDKIESWGKRDRLIDRGEAFDYLYARRRESPHVANAELIDFALNLHIPKFNKNADGQVWYAYEALDRFVVEGPIGLKSPS